jgi:hypothetical protein
MREEREIFCIKIINMEALLVPYTLTRTVAFSMLREPIGCLLLVIFFDIFLICKEGKGLLGMLLV